MPRSNEMGKDLEKSRSRDRQAANSGICTKKRLICFAVILILLMIGSFIVWIIVKDGKTFDEVNTQTNSKLPVTTTSPANAGVEGSDANLTGTPYVVGTITARLGNAPQTTTAAATRVSETNATQFNAIERSEKQKVSKTESQGNSRQFLQATSNPVGSAASTPSLKTDATDCTSPAGQSLTKRIASSTEPPQTKTSDHGDSSQKLQTTSNPAGSADVTPSLKAGATKSTAPTGTEALKLENETSSTNERIVTSGQEDETPTAFTNSRPTA